MQGKFICFALLSLLISGCHVDNRQEQTEVNKIERKTERAEKEHYKQSQQIRDMGTQESSVTE